jgi:hypothetical protein
LEESFRLLKRHGIKLWFTNVIGGLIVAALLLVPHLFIGMMLAPQLAPYQSEASRLLTLPTLTEKMTHFFQLAGHIFAEAQGFALVYMIGIMIITLLSGFFLAAGVIGTVRGAVVEDKVSLGAFFSFGIRFMMRIMALGIVKGLGIALSGSLIYWGALQSGTGVDIVLYIAGGLIGLIWLSAVTQSLIVLYTEEFPLFRGLRYGFQAAIVKPVQSMTAFLGAVLISIVSAALVGFLATFPWFLLQWFEDGAVALIVGVALGALFYSVFSMVPSLLALGVLFSQYIIAIQPHLFPEEKTRPQPVPDEHWEPQESAFHNDWRDQEPAPTLEDNWYEEEHSYPETASHPEEDWDSENWHGEDRQDVERNERNWERKSRTF